MFVLGFLCIMPYANASGHCGEMCGDGTCVSTGGSGFNDLICGPAEGLLKYVPSLGNGDCTNLGNPVVIGSMCLLNNNDRSNYVCLPNPGPFLTNTGGLTPEVPISFDVSGIRWAFCTVLTGTVRTG